MTDNKQLIDDEAKVIASKLADVMAKDAGDLHVDPYMAPDDWGIIPASQLEDAVKNNLMHVTDIRKSKGQYDPYTVKRFICLLFFHQMIINTTVLYVSHSLNLK